MPDSTTSAVLTAPREIKLQEFNIPEIGEDDALISVELTGVCGTDVKVYTGAFREELLPLILGHEVVGTVEKIGRAASEQFSVSEGDRVVVDPLRRCGSCYHCVVGDYPSCEHIGGPKSSGVHGYISTELPPSLWGGYGEYMYIDSSSIIYPLAEDTSADAAVLAVAIVGNSVGWLQAADVNPLQKSLIIQGPGPQGLSMTLVAKAMGFSPIVVVGVPGDEKRLEMATKLGADHVICEEPDRLVPSTQSAVGTADVVVNITGSASSVQHSVDLVSRNGTIVHASLVGDETSEVSFDKLVRKNAAIQGVLSRTASQTRQAIRLIEERQNDFAQLVSDHYPLSEADEAIRCAGGYLEGPSPLKIVIDPNL